MEDPRDDAAPAARPLQVYGTWAVTRLGAVALLFWLAPAAAGWFVAGFAIAEIGVLRAKAREQHWRQMAAKMAERARELQAAENGRIAAAAKQRIAADLARMNAEIAPKLSTRQQLQQQVDHLVPAKRRKDVH